MHIIGYDVSLIPVVAAVPEKSEELLTSNTSLHSFQHISHNLKPKQEKGGAKTICISQDPPLIILPSSHKQLAPSKWTTWWQLLENLDYDVEYLHRASVNNYSSIGGVILCANSNHDISSREFCQLQCYLITCTHTHVCMHKQTSELLNIYITLHIHVNSTVAKQPPDVAISWHVIPTIW